MEVDRGVCRLPAKPILGTEGCLTAAAASSWAGVAGVSAGEQTIYNTPLIKGRAQPLSARQQATLSASHQGAKEDEGLSHLRLRAGSSSGSR